MIRYQQFVAVGAVLLSAVALTGCFKASGGGVLTDVISKHIISVGFAMRCNDVGGVGIITGEFQFHDLNDGRAFHGVINSQVFNPLNPGNVTCEAADLTAQMFGAQNTFGAQGTYTPQPQTLGEGGAIQVTIQDGPGPFLSCLPGQDAVVIQLTGGVYGGHPAEQACLDHGNFTVFTE